MRYADGHIEFHDGTRIAYDQPKNTLDPRYTTCTVHHTACICREAEYAEEVNEYRTEYYGLRNAISEICAGHPSGCMCTGCQIARRCHLSFLPLLGDIR